MSRWSMAVIIFSISFALPSLCLADAPEWGVGIQFEGAQSMTFTAPLPGVQLHIQATSSQVPFYLAETGQRQHQQGDMGLYDVYVLTYSAPATAAGTVAMTNPIPFAAQIRLVNGTWSGEFWVRITDQAIVTRTRTLSGNLEADLFGEFMPIGTIEFEEIEEYQPPLQEIPFPPAVGDTWSNAPSVYCYGGYEMDLVIFGDPYQVAESFERMSAFSFSASVEGMEPINSCDSYRAHQQDAANGADNWFYYCPDFAWASRIIQTNVVFNPIDGHRDAQPITLEAYQLDVTSVGYPTPTPTLTPSPSPTPSPVLTWTPTFTATSTPTIVPTATPTSPPATPTPTPTATVEPTFTPTAEPHLGVILDMPSDYYTVGTACYLKALIGNPGDGFSAVFVALLDIGTGDYWFYPSWRHYPAEDIDYQQLRISPGIYEKVLVPEFSWPAVEGQASGLWFHSALLNSEITEIIGQIGSVSFSYGP